MTANFKSTIELLKSAHEVVILGHTRADADCYGSMFALYQGLTMLGKNVRILMNEEYPSNLDFLFGYFDGEIVSKYTAEPDVIILLDASDIDRISASDFVKNQIALNKKIIHLDHHTKGDLDNLATISIRVEEACSTCEVVYNLLTAMDIAINKNIATCLLAGIIDDTNSFENQNTNQECFAIASNLLAKGARLKVINQHLFGGREVDTLKLWGLAMERLSLDNKYQAAVTYLTLADIEHFGISGDILSGVVNYLNSIRGAKMVILITEEQEGLIKVSLRTRDEKVNVARLARQFGGGGHVKAAGLVIPGHLSIVSGKPVITN